MSLRTQRCDPVNASSEDAPGRMQSLSRTGETGAIGGEWWLFARLTKTSRLMARAARQSRWMRRPRVLCGAVSGVAVPVRTAAPSGRRGRSGGSSECVANGVAQGADAFLDLPAGGGQGRQLDAEDARLLRFRRGDGRLGGSRLRGGRLGRLRLMGGGRFGGGSRPVRLVGGGPNGRLFLGRRLPDFRGFGLGLGRLGDGLGCLGPDRFALGASTFGRAAACGRVAWGGAASSRARTVSRGVTRAAVRAGATGLTAGGGDTTATGVGTGMRASGGLASTIFGSGAAAWTTPASAALATSGAAAPGAGLLNPATGPGPPDRVATFTGSIFAAATGGAASADGLTAEAATTGSPSFKSGHFEASPPSITGAAATATAGILAGGARMSPITDEAAMAKPAKATTPTPAIARGPSTGAVRRGGRGGSRTRSGRTRTSSAISSRMNGNRRWSERRLPARRGRPTLSRIDHQLGRDNTAQ